MDLPTSSKIVIVGGGIVGCSTAHHLAKMGHEVLLLEKQHSHQVPLGMRQG